jgi:hypothetical protein
MPLEVKYINDGVGVLYIVAGKITGKEIIIADQIQLDNIERLKKKKWHLSDFSEAEEIDITNEELRQMAELDKTMVSTTGLNISAVVANEGLMFGLGRMWEIFVEINKVNWHTRIFKTRLEAEVWLKEEAMSLFNIDLTISST